jgi:hypothetical protein
MKQALHIFRKDVRRFAYQICALTALTFVWAWANVPGGQADFPNVRFAGMAGAVLIVGWFYLISLLVHEESLTGNRQFWVTRPYSRRSLAAAKLLFVLAFLNVPLLLGGFAILASAGYQPLAYLPNFLWMQLTFAAVVLLLPAALAALTRNLVQFVLTFLGLIGLLLLTSIAGTMVPHYGATFQSNGLVWAVGIFLMLSIAAPALLVFFLQLRTRNRLVSASAGVALLVLTMFIHDGVSRQFGIAVQSRMFGENGARSVDVILDAAGIQSNAKQPEPGSVTLAVPLRVVNMTAFETAAPEIVELTFETPAGRRWSSRWMAAASTTRVFQENPSPDGTFTWKQRAVVDSAFWQQARSGPMTIRGAVYIKIFGHRSVRLQTDGMTPVPGDGRCFVSPLSPSMRGPRYMVKCIAPFHMPVTGMEPQPGPVPDQSDQPTHLLSIWDSPLPADFGMNPLSFQPSFPNGPQIFFLRYDPHAYIRRTFEAINVHLPL